MSARFIVHAAATLELQAYVERAAQKLLATEIHTPDEILSDLLPAVKLALEIAGFANGEDDCRAFYDCLRDYLEAPTAFVEVERLPAGGIVA